MALGYMRRHKKWLFVFLWLVIAAFIILYIPAFQDAGQGTPGEVLGQVGELPITVGEFQKAYLQQRRFYDRLYEGRLDAAALRSLGLEEQTFQGLVAERLVQLEAQRLGLAVDDEAVARRLANAPEFQQDGRFLGANEIRRRLELQGSTVGEFEQSLRHQLLRERLESLVTAGVTVTEGEAEQEYRRRTEQIRAEYVLVDASRFESEVSAEPTEVQAYFDAHKEQYRVPKKRVLSYLLLDTEALRPQITVTDQDIQSYYRMNPEEFQQEETVCASHILIKVAEAESESEGHADAEALELADGLLARIRAGEDLAELAKQFSEDRGTAEAGGDLGCFPRGRMVPEFENIAFSLDPEEISDVVRSAFGYHIIRLNSRSDEVLAPLEAVQEQIRQRLLAERLRAMVEEKVNAMAAALATGGTLEKVASKQGLTVEKSEPLARGDSVEPLASPLLVARAFELGPQELVEQPFQVSRGYAFIQLSDTQASRLPELAEVEEQARQDLLAERRSEKARELAAEIRSQAETRGLEQAARAKGLERKQTEALVGRGQALGDLGTGATLDEVAFSLPEQSLSDPVPVEKGYAVLKVVEKKPFDPEAFQQQKDRIAAALRAERQNQLFQAYMSQARDRFPVERNTETFRRLVG